MNGKNGTAKVMAVMDRTFGKGQAIEVAYPDGNRDQMLLFPELPFLLFRSSLHNGGEGDVSHPPDASGQRCR